MGRGVIWFKFRSANDSRSPEVKYSVFSEVLLPHAGRWGQATRSTRALPKIEEGINAHRSHGDDQFIFQKCEGHDESRSVAYPMFREGGATTATLALRLDSKFSTVEA